MLVEVIRLREEGLKLSREKLRGAEVFEAELWMFRMANGVVRANYGPPGGSCTCFLEPAAIVTMRGTDFLVVGLETIGKYGAQRQVPQAWWCRLAGGHAAHEARQPAELAGAALAAMA